MVYLYHSDVFFVRAAIERRLGFLPTLLEVECVMKECGWTGSPKVKKNG